jgi:diguanylate cyclase (GGDEF)-like protein/PAS domain S-box-containing protein
LASEAAPSGTLLQVRINHSVSAEISFGLHENRTAALTPFCLLPVHERSMGGKAPLTTPSGEGTQRAMADARPEQRAHAPAMRARGRHRTAQPKARHPLPAYWIWMGVVTGIGVIASSIVTLELPPLAVAACMGVAIALFFFGPYWLYRPGMDRWREEPRLRYVSIGLFVLLPMALVGLGYGLWLLVYDVDPFIGLAGLVAYSTIAGAFLSRDITLYFASQTVCWMVPGMLSPSYAGAVAFAIVIGAQAIIARTQENIRMARERKKAAERRLEERARTLLIEYEQTGQGWFFETDRHSMIAYVSEPVARVLGYEPEGLIGQPLTTMFDLASGASEKERTLPFHLSARSTFTELPVRAALEGEERWWSISGRPVYDEFDNFVGFRGAGTDLTEKRRSQERASHLAHFDSLTGLANRLQMSQTLEKILSNQQEERRACAIFLLDLDRFKQVNDTLGHPAGDALLKQVSARLKNAVEDSGQVGRLGGDEFQVVLAGRRAPRDLVDLAQRIIDMLSQPYQIEGHRVVIGASIGIALCPDNGVSSEDLIRNADLALYAAKDGGRGRYHFYADDLHEQAEERRKLEHDLRDAIATGSLELYYQPVIEMARERIIGFEALLRWDHPVHGMIPTQKFVDIAEDAGLIGAIGEWALRHACHTLAEWPDDVRCAVNVSPLQFANPQLPTIVTNAIAQAGIDPSRLELEITESVFLSDEKGTDEMFAALKRVGVRLALDDFGTGYSSLGYLKKAPFDKIKIDQSFVRGATEPGSRNGAIITSITSLAQALGMDTTAEGVETVDELELVRDLGCSQVQGFIYSRPMARAQIDELLQKGLEAKPTGPRSSRAARQTMLRKVRLHYHDQVYKGTIRNMSYTGLMVEGLWNVPPGTPFDIEIAADRRLLATSRWSIDDRMGLEFAEPLARDGEGRIILLDDLAAESTVQPMRKAG